MKLDSIICLIDALNYEHLLQSHPEIALDQLEFADFVVLNKCDLIDGEKKNLLHTLIRRVNAFAPIIEASHGKVDIDLLLSTGRFSMENLREEKKEHVHGHENLQVFSYVPNGKFKAKELDAFLEDLTTDCYRIKGFVEFIERPNEWWLIQKAGARFTMDPWTGEIPTESRMVFIGKDMDESLIRKLLDETTENGRSVLFMT